jgi:hypothetical protein
MEVSASRQVLSGANIPQREAPQVRSRCGYTSLFTLLKESRQLCDVGCYPPGFIARQPIHETTTGYPHKTDRLYLPDAFSCFCLQSLVVRSEAGAASWLARCSFFERLVTFLPESGLRSLAGTEAHPVCELGPAAGPSALATAQDVTSAKIAIALFISTSI